MELAEWIGDSSPERPGNLSEVTQLMAGVWVQETQKFTAPKLGVGGPGLWGECGGGGVASVGDQLLGSVKQTLTLPACPAAAGPGAPQEAFPNEVS